MQLSYHYVNKHSWKKIKNLVDFLHPTHYKHCISEKDSSRKEKVGMNVFIFTKVKESRQGERDKTVNGKIGCEERHSKPWS